jgi:hypothetical protein
MPSYRFFPTEKVSLEWSWMSLAAPEKNRPCLHAAKPVSRERPLSGRVKLMILLKKHKLMLSSAAGRRSPEN